LSSHRTELKADDDKVCTALPARAGAVRCGCGGRLGGLLRTADAALYGTFTGSPNSAGWITEIAYLPFSYGGPAFWPWLKMPIGLQYTL
jgi:hypothetical protein